MRSKGDVSRVFLATVSHGIGFLFLFSFAACFVVRGFRACVLLFAALGGGVPRPDFARRGPKDVFVDSKGNVKGFFGSGFGRFRLVSRWCLGLFGSRAPRPERVLLFEAFGLVFCCSRLILRQFCSVFCCARLWACVLLFEAFGSGGPRPDFARPKRCFCGFHSGFGRFRLVSRWCLGLFGSRAPRPERVLLFEAFGLVFCCSRLILRQFCSVFCCARLWACVLLFEAFGSDVPKARFREAQKMFLWIPKVT